MHRAAFVFGLLTLSPASAIAASVTLTGWFACEKCTAPRAAKGIFKPNNPECAKKCMEEGSPAVFISEQSQELLRLKNGAVVADHLGYHVEVTGEVDQTSKTISIHSVKQLSSEGVSCARPRRSTK